MNHRGPILLLSVLQILSVILLIMVVDMPELLSLHGFLTIVALVCISFFSYAEGYAAREMQAQEEIDE